MRLDQRSAGDESDEHWCFSNCRLLSSLLNSGIKNKKKNDMLLKEPLTVHPAAQILSQCALDPMVGAALIEVPRTLHLAWESHDRFFSPAECSDSLKFRISQIVSKLQSLRKRKKEINTDSHLRRRRARGVGPGFEV